jgi:acetyl-CoA carboxylase biotin carboxyl carrier protein
MDRDRILALIGKLKASGATELEVVDGGVRVRVVRPAPPTRPSGASGRATVESAAEAGVLGCPEPEPPHGVLVVSHVVGFFRRGREPGAEPLAEAGQTVRKGQPLGYVEALRRAVAIEAPVDGEVIEFLAEDGARVEYATPLVRLHPAGSES